MIEKQEVSLLPKANEITSFVASGGGSKGIAYLGVQARLEAANFPWHNIERVAGTSAGAMFALSIALAFSTEELKNLLLGIDYKSIISIKNWQIGSMFKKHGLIQSPFDHEWFEKLIYKKTQIENCTFKELHDLREAHPEFKDLYVVAVNVNTQEATTFSYETTPNYIISDAVKLSTLIPGLFVPDTPYEKINGHRQKVRPADLYADGGILENYPIDIFDRDRYIKGSNKNTEIPVFNLQTLGFKFFSPTPRTKTNNTIDVIKAEIDILKDAGQSNEFIRENQKLRTILIDTGDIQATDFDLSNKQKIQLITSGWNSMNNFFGVNYPVPQELINLQSNNAEESVEESASCCAIS